MVCERVFECMMQALDGELEPAQRVEMEAHLVKCAACRAEWRRLQALEGLLRETPVARVPVGFSGRLMARVDRRSQFRRLALGGLSFAAGLATLFLLTLAPALRGLPGLAWSLPALAQAGSVMVAGLVDALNTVLDSLWLSAGALVLPVAPVALCGMSMAFVAGLLWMRLLRRLRPATVAVMRR